MLRERCEAGRHSWSGRSQRRSSGQPALCCGRPAGRPGGPGVRGPLPTPGQRRGSGQRGGLAGLKAAPASACETPLDSRSAPPDGQPSQHQELSVPSARNALSCESQGCLEAASSRLGRTFQHSTGSGSRLGPRALGCPGPRGLHQVRAQAAPSTTGRWTAGECHTVSHTASGWRAHLSEGHAQHMCTQLDTHDWMHTQVDTRTAGHTHLMDTHHTDTHGWTHTDSHTQL